MDDATLAAQIRALDRACYVGETWQGGEALAHALTDLPGPKSPAPASRRDSALAPLYP
jgi:hypothetical protein